MEIADNNSIFTRKGREPILSLEPEVTTRLAIPPLRHRLSSTKIAYSASSESIREMFKAEMRKAKRNGHWFRLTGTERGFFSLATRLRVEFKSYDLLRAMVAILKKLKEAGDRAYGMLMKGRELAWTFSEAAVRWGNSKAYSWRNDRNYILFLGRGVIWERRI